MTEAVEAWDATRIKALKKCPAYLQMAYNEGWRGKSKSIHLVFGAAFAKGLEDFYHGMSLDEVVANAMKVRLPEDAEKNNLSLVRSLVWYIDKYKDEEILIRPDGKPAIEIPFKWSPAPGVVFCGHMDRVAIIGGHPFVIDQKTTGKPLTSFFFQQYAREDQMYMYSLIAKEVLGSPIAGVIIDGVQVTSDYTEFNRDIVTFSKPELDEWLSDTLDFIYRMGTSHAHNTSSCYRCDFRPVCSAPPAIRENYKKALFSKQTPWNPLEPRT